MIVIDLAKKFSTTTPEEEDNNVSSLSSTIFITYVLCICAARYAPGLGMTYVSCSLFIFPPTAIGKEIVPEQAAGEDEEYNSVFVNEYLDTE